MSTITVYRSDYRDEAAYRQALQEAKKSYQCNAKVDDGNGGTAWKFFESEEEMRVWKNQR